MTHPIPADAPGTDHRPQPGSALKRVTGSRWLPVGVLVLAAVIGLVLAAAVGPRSTLGDLRGGDPILVADVEAVIGDTGGLGALSVARLRDGKVTYAGLGAVDGSAPTPQTPYELGSITKTFTGMLLADAVTRKEVELDDPVASYLTELASTPAGGATLCELATHTSGLPTLPPTSRCNACLGSCSTTTRTHPPPPSRCWPRRPPLRSATGAPTPTPTWGWRSSDTPWPAPPANRAGTFWSSSDCSIRSR